MTCEPFQDMIRGAFSHCELRLRERLRERAYKRHGQFSAYAVRQAQRQLSDRQIALLDQILLGARDLFENSTPVRIEALSRFIQSHAATVAIKQPLAHLRLQQRDVPAQRRLRDRRHLGRARKTAHVGDADEIFELSKIHRHPDFRKASLKLSQNSIAGSNRK
jgi:hypothetical protein